MMTMRSLLALAGVCALLVSPAHAVKPGETVPNLAFKDIRDNARQLSDYTQAKGFVLAILGCECPVNTAIMPSLTKFAQEYESKGIVVIGIYPNVQDSLVDVTEHSRKHQLPFPCVKDFNAKLADSLGATRTPEFLVLDAQRTVRYRGRFDDQFGFLKSGQNFARPAPQSNDVRDAVDAMLDNRKIEQVTTEVLGCLIGRERRVTPGAKLTYAKDVAPLLHKHCAGCHRPGEIGPFSLLSYDDAAGWGEMIAEVVREKRMPPWHASDPRGKFSNDRSLTEEETKTILQWVESGMPAGDLKQAPAAPTFVDGWGLGKPDRIYTMPEPFTVPAKGTVDYQWIRIDPKLDEDIWVSAVEIRPGARSVVHHVLMYILPPGVRRLDERTEAGFFAAYAPGHNPMFFPPGYGKKIVKGSTILFQMHYTANGTATADRSSVGLVTVKGPLKEMDTLGIANPRLLLPAGKADVEITSAHKLTQDVTLYAMMPHTHLRGKAFKYEAILPDGTVEELLNVSRYDFNWQPSYHLAEPKKLPKDAVIRCVAIYDNSTNNPSNPDPKVDVRWGRQTWEEMMIGYIDYVPSTNKLEPAGGSEGATRRKAFLITLYLTLDKNRDGKIEESEVPEAQKQTFRRLLERYDMDNDGKLAKSEVPGLND